MPGVWRGVRVAGVLVTVGVVVGCWLWGLQRWDRGAHAVIAANERLRLERAGQPSGELDASEADRARPGRGSSGEISVRLHHDRDGEWALTTRYRLALKPTDPLVDELRIDPSFIEKVIAVVPGGEESSNRSDDFDESYEGGPRWCRLSQNPEDGTVTVTAERTTARSEADVFPANTLQYSFGNDVLDRDGRKVAFPHGRWTWSLEAPAPWGISFKGRPAVQTTESVHFLMSAKARPEFVAVTYNPTYEEQDADADADAVTVTGLKGALSLGAAVAVAVAALLSFGSRALRRFLALGATLLACTALALLVWDLIIWDWEELYWLRAATRYWAYNMPANGTPFELRFQGVLLGTLLFALPLLAVCGERLVRTDRPPPLRHVLALVLPAAALLVASRLLGGPLWTWPTVACALAASAAAGAVLLAAVLAGAAVRTWASALAAAVFAGVAASVALEFVPVALELRWDESTAVPFHPGLASWPLTYLLLTPWVTALLLLVVPQVPKAVRIALLPLLVSALLPWWTPYVDADYAHPPSFPLLVQLTGQWPAESFVGGIRVIAPAFQVIWLTCAIVLLAQLRRAGASPGHWGASAHSSCTALLLLAALAPLAGDPEVWLPHWTTAAALAVVWLGARILLPAEREQRATRLHALTGAAHARLVNSLARALLFAEGRHRFLTASRGTLADAAVTPEEWQQRWHSLRAPTAPDAAREAARLRAAALGGSGGTAAWANGVVAALVSGLLTAPWTAWPAWHGRGYSGLPEAVTVAGAATWVWLAHGFVYGYLYPWIRGRGPVSKAGWLWAVMAPVQLLLLWPRLRLPFDQTALTVCLLLAQSAVMALGLALYWEIRLIHRADLLWGHVRNFRRLSSLAAPVSTVLVAAVAAAVTVLASSWAGDLTAPEVPPSLPSPTATNAR
ncbi:hypothetical protein [Streptomyces sp. NPDC003635]